MTASFTVVTEVAGGEHLALRRVQVGTVQIDADDEAVIKAGP